MPDGEPALSIEVAIACDEWRRACPQAEALSETAARLAFGAAATRAGFPSTDRVVIGITLSDDSEQRRLNREYRGRDAPTNVLAFPAADPSEQLPPGAPLLLGDVVLALETVAREAAEQNKPLSDHLRHLVVHGVLHLVGEDHHEPAQAEMMERHETAILAQLGVPDPYRDTI